MFVVISMFKWTVLQLSIMIIYNSTWSILIQLSIMIIYNSTWSILIQWIMDMIVRWHSGLVNTKESALPVCDKPYHTNKRKVQKGEEIEVLRNCTLMVSYRCLTSAGGGQLDNSECGRGGSVSVTGHSGRESLLYTCNGVFNLFTFGLWESLFWSVSQDVGQPCNIIFLFFSHL